MSVMSIDEYLFFREMLNSVLDYALHTYTIYQCRSKTQAYTTLRHARYLARTDLLQG